MKDRQFRTAARDAGLLYTDWPSQCGDNLFGHNFNLNSGDVVGRPEPHQVNALVELASTFADTPTCGEHLALLSLAADEDDVAEFESGNRQLLLWRSSVSSGAETGRISLREWLASNGYFPKIEGAEAAGSETTGGDSPLSCEFPGGIAPEEQPTDG